MKNRMIGESGVTALVEDDRQIPGKIDRAIGRMQSADLSAPEVDVMSDRMAATELRRKGEALIVPAERVPSAGSPVWLRNSCFIFMHVACLAVFLTGVNVQVLALCGSVYLLQVVGITVGYHRYLSHRSFKTSRAFQFVLAWLGCSAAQKGPLWWVAYHRHHHRTSDTPEDLHSPVVHSIWRAHVGWVLSRDSDNTDDLTVNDLSRFPELRWLDRYHWVPPLAVGVLCFVTGRWSGLVWGFFVSSVLSHHATFLVNSACHLWGRRRFATPDASRNNWCVVLLTLGEGWHNNHHHYQSSANQGFRWWELDVSYYLIRLLAFVGLVWDVRTPPPEKLRSFSAASRPTPTQPTMKENEMPVYVIAKAGHEFPDTPVFHAGSSGSEEAIAVFTDRDSADRCIIESGWSDHEVGELTSQQLLQWMVKAHENGIRLLAVNPDRTGQLAGKQQVVVTIEEKLTEIANSLSRDVLGV